ncbi:hypothetical protein HOL34_02895 [bacterium]|jgi:hypothetical protein|nr:hypothetical protein [bacterium]MBT3903407.1 hypothetical protein [bacterium]MBT4578012.1 hypothetical protein [bacterium]MBT5345762.1 hypothetical protein [bacterium]MBT6130897.1 hypothetical protein [bacterium]
MINAKTILLVAALLANAPSSLIAGRNEFFGPRSPRIPSNNNSPMDYNFPSASGGLKYNSSTNLSYGLKNDKKNVSKIKSPKQDLINKKTGSPVNQFAILIDKRSSSTTCRPKTPMHNLRRITSSNNIECQG